MPYAAGGPERALRTARQKVANSDFPDQNKDAIFRFSEACFSEGLSTTRVVKYLYMLYNIARWTPGEFERLTRKDVEIIARRIEQSRYAEWTKHDYKVALKKFFRWLRGCEDGYPPEVRWLRTTMRKQRTKLPEDILTQEEVQAMVAVATNARDRALVASLYESGCRVGELLTLTVRQVQSHQHGFQITVNGKKGPRRLLLIASAPYMAAWLNEHPKRQNPQAPLWVTGDQNAKPLGHGRTTAILKRAARRAGVVKAVNPHNFRHTRATHLAKHLTEAQMNEYMGWVQGSDMPSTYVHLSGRDVDQALLRLNKIQVQGGNDAQETFAIKNCPRCGLGNAPANRFCSRCGGVLDEKAAQNLIKSRLERSTADDIMDELLEDPEFRETLARKLNELREAKRTTSTSG